MPGHIVPMGAGKAVMERRNDPLHDYVLELTGKGDPVVLFLPTATGDEASYIVSFYEAFHSGRCRPRHLRLFHRDYDDLTDIVLGADVIHVGGGNTANMLDVWRRQGVDDLLHRALAKGAVLTGGSAGGLCWFEGGTTDSFGPTLQLLHEGLGMIKGSYCPHYDAEDQRRPLFHAALLDGSLEMGYASWNRVAIRFTPEGEVVEAVTSEPGGRALKVYAARRRDRRGRHPVPSTRGASPRAAASLSEQHGWHTRLVGRDDRPADSSWIVCAERSDGTVDRWNNSIGPSGFSKPAWPRLSSTWWLARETAITSIPFRADVVRSERNESTAVASTDPTPRMSRTSYRSCDGGRGHAPRSIQGSLD